MHFVGRKVTIRAVEREDLPLLRDFHNDPEVGAMIEFSWPLSMGNQERFFERVTTDPNTKRLVIEVPDEGVIGYTGLWGIDWINRHAVHGVVIGRRDLQGRGYGTDAVNTMARVAFDHVNLHRLEAHIYAFNEASLKLYVDRCGWTEEGRRRESLYRAGRYWDTVIVGITAEEFRALGG
ncbi:MAG: GNAT family N-acetyltransferase [Myxococcota bacterium]